MPWPSDDALMPRKHCDGTIHFGPAVAVKLATASQIAVLVIEETSGTYC
jgi:hypothetical protein